MTLLQVVVAGRQNCQQHMILLQPHMILPLMIHYLQTHYGDVGIVVITHQYILLKVQ